VLPAEHRLRTSDEFRSVVRQGVRAGRHPGGARTSYADSAVTGGFVVSKAVGNAVTRNRVKRQLRHLVAGELAHGPDRVAVVVRALPPAAVRTPGRGLRPGVGVRAGQAGCDAMKYVLIGLLKAYRAVISPLYGERVQVPPHVLGLRSGRRPHATEPSRARG
jgi:ribonuclease P protein component